MNRESESSLFTLFVPEKELFQNLTTKPIFAFFFPPKKVDQRVSWKFSRPEEVLGAVSVGSGRHIFPSRLFVGLDSCSSAAASSGCGTASSGYSQARVDTKRIHKGMSHGLFEHGGDSGVNVLQHDDPFKTPMVWLKPASLRACVSSVLK